MIHLDRNVTPSAEAIAFAMEGMRNAMNSWDAMDTKNGEIGKNDIHLARKLIAAGSEHRKFLRQLTYLVRIKAPMYFWKEMDTYKISTTRNSTSTMHKITSKPFALADFSCERIDISHKSALAVVIGDLNVARNEYLAEKDPEKKKELWYTMIQLLPSSYNQTAHMSFTYETLYNIYNQRKNHKLEEWHVFCSMLEKDYLFWQLFIKPEEV